MALKNFLQRINIAKTATIFVVVYAVFLSAAALVAVFAGPFEGELKLLVKNRSLEADLRASDKMNKGLQAERDRLLMAVKNLQNNLDTSQTTVKALRRSVDGAAVAKDLASANQIADKLNKERAVLVAKLDNLQQELQNIANAGSPKENKKTALETSDLVASLEKEKAELQMKIKTLEERNKN